MEMIKLTGNVTLQAVKDDQGKPFAVLKPMCETLGLEYSSVFKMLRDRRWATIAKIATVGMDGKNREMTCIDGRTILMWLAGVDPDKCNVEIRESLETYQDEAADALNRWANGNPGAVVDITSTLIQQQTILTNLVQQQGETQRQMIKMQNDILGICDRIESQTKGNRNEFKTDIKRQYRTVVNERYSGRCPCCQNVSIMESGKLDKAANPQYEHFHHRSMNNIEHGWLVCGQCNINLRDRTAGGFWFEAGPAFQQFQRLLADDSQKRLEF